MQYLNPFDLFDRQIKSLNELNSSIIKKEKKRILAEIELNDDNSIIIKNKKFIRSDILNAFNELEDLNKREFYYFLYNYQELNNFLFNGETKFFVSFRRESIFTLQEFIDFISPYYAPKYSKVLLKALKGKNEKALKILNSIPLLVNNKFLDQAYFDSYNYLQNKIKFLSDISNQIKSGKSDYDENNISDLVEIIKNEIHIETINLLSEYFNEIRNSLAYSLRNLSVNVFNNIGDLEVALELLKIALNLKIDSLTKNKLEKDFKQLEEIINERKENEKYEPLLNNYARIFIRLKNETKKLENKNTNPENVIKIIKDIINVEELNTLPDFFNEIREQFALIIRSISITSWNEFSDINNSINILKIARSINVSEEIATLLEKDYKTLLEILEQRKKYGKPIKRAPNLQLINGCGTTLYGSTLYFVIIGIPILPLARYSYDKISPGHYRFYGKLELYPWQKFWKYSFITIFIIWFLSNFINSNLNQSYSEEQSINKNKNYSNQDTPLSSFDNNFNEVYNSKYKGNHLNNGNSPYNRYFGKGIYNKSHHNWILFKNNNYLDAIVCLVDQYSHRTIRNEYIKAGTNFKMTNIPNGTYYIKVFYGKDWNPNKIILDGKIKGGFDTDFHFYKSNKLISLFDNGYRYTTYEITLSSSYGNIRQNSISALDFFK